MQAAPRWWQPHRQPKQTRLSCYHSSSSDDSSDDSSGDAVAVAEIVAKVRSALRLDWLAQEEANPGERERERGRDRDRDRDGYQGFHSMICPKYKRMYDADHRRLSQMLHFGAPGTITACPASGSSATMSSPGRSRSRCGVRASSARRGFRVKRENELGDRCAGLTS